VGFGIIDPVLDYSSYPFVYLRGPLIASFAYALESAFVDGALGEVASYVDEKL
jgi:hypothetical protein